MSAWLAEAIRTFGSTSLLENYRFDCRPVRLELPVCVGFHVPDFFYKAIHNARKSESVEICTYSNILLHHGDVFGLDDHPVVPGPIGYIPQKADSILGELTFDKKIIFDDTYMLATTHHSAHNFYHFLIDYTSNTKFAALVESGVAPFFVSKGVPEFQADVMQVLLGRCYPVRLFSTTYLFRRLAIPGALPKSAIVDFLRERASRLEPKGSGRRIYVSRRRADVRRVLNEEEIEGCLHKYGFEIIDCERLAFSQQIALFKSADIVCAPHGAGLSNIAFCSRGCAIIEFFMSERLPLSALFWELGCAAGTKHYFVGASRVDNASHPYAGEGDFIVNPVHLEEAILLAVARNGPRRMLLELPIA